MRNSLTMLVKAISLSIALAALLLLNSGLARADEVTISGSTTGTVTGVPQLTFTGNNFIGTTSFGIGSLSGVNSLGTFFLNTSGAQLLNGAFTLNVVFTQPAGITGGQATNYTATILGSVSPNPNQGGVHVKFDNPTQTFNFSNSTGPGTFSLTVSDLFVQTGSFAQLTAGFTSSSNPVPEPATLFLLGTGLTGMAGFARRRLKRSQSI
ncbi:MAG: PEP-CTERM sorting domain-containing protein [Acidobacteriota bacterium]|nr:PEP-CTERM sorting domain-containing protein [Acidobacteriota bacterium]